MTRDEFERVTPYPVKCPRCGEVWAYSSEPMPEGEECIKCFSEVMEKLREESWKEDVGKRNKRYEPELGQVVFGNRWSELQLPSDVERYVTSELNALFGRLTPCWYIYEAVGPDFELRSYVWDDCICEDEEIDPNCRACKPNFRLGDLAIRWYKYPGRGMSVNRPVTREELIRVFDRVRVLVAKGLVRVKEEPTDDDEDDSGSR